MYRPLSATRTRSCEIRLCLRILSASNSATRSAPVLAWRDGGTLCVCRAGRCGHRPLRLFIGNRCVGVGLPDDPSRTCAAALAKLSLRASDRRHWCGNDTLQKMQRITGRRGEGSTPYGGQQGGGGAGGCVHRPLRNNNGKRGDKSKTGG